MDISLCDKAGRRVIQCGAFSLDRHTITSSRRLSHHSSIATVIRVLVSRQSSCVSFIIVRDQRSHTPRPAIHARPVAG